MGTERNRAIIAFHVSEVSQTKSQDFPQKYKDKKVPLINSDRRQLRPGCLDAGVRCPDAALLPKSISLYAITTTDDFPCERIPHTLN